MIKIILLAMSVFLVNAVHLNDLPDEDKKEDETKSLIPKDQLQNITDEYLQV